MNTESSLLHMNCQSGWRSFNSEEMVINTCMYFRLCTSLMPTERGEREKGGGGARERCCGSETKRRRRRENMKESREETRETNTKRQIGRHSGMGAANPSQPRITDVWQCTGNGLH